MVGVEAQVAQAMTVLNFVIVPAAILAGILLTRKLTRGEIMSDLQAAIDAVTEQLAHAKFEIVNEIQRLEAQIVAGETPDLTALKAAAQALEDVVVDVEAPAPDVPVEDVPADVPAVSEEGLI